MANDPDTSLPSGTLERGDAAQMKPRVAYTNSGDIRIDGSVSGTGIAIGHGATAIVTIYQQILRPLPYSFRAGVQRMVEDYTAIFGGRDSELAQLDEFLLHDERPFALLLAQTGRGKTALLIHWIARVQQVHPQWRVIFAPISIRYQTASEQVTLGLLAYSLAEIHSDLEQFRSYEQSPTSLRAIVADYLRRPLPENVRLLVVLDGLDETTGWTVSSELFPHSPESHLKVVVAARELAHTTRNSWYRSLGFTPRRTHDLTLEGLHQTAVRDMLRRLGNPFDALATDVDVLAELERVSQGDPVIIRLLVELLLDEKIQPGQLADLPRDDVNAVFELWVRDLRQHDRTHERVFAFLCLVAIAYGPLTTDDILQLDSSHLPEPRDVEDAARAVARFVIGDGTLERGYVFSHQKLREVYREQRIGYKQQKHLQQRFIQYGMDWYADRSQPLSDYLRLHWVTHLSEAGEWVILRRVLTEIVPVIDNERYIQPWADVRYRAEGSHLGYLSDLNMIWQWADMRRDIPLSVRCALIATSTHSFSSGLTPELLIGLVTAGTPEGRWSATAVLDNIALMTDYKQRGRLLITLASTRIELPWSRVIDLAKNIPDVHHRIRTLVKLAAYMPDELKEMIFIDAVSEVDFSGIPSDRLNLIKIGSRLSDVSIDEKISLVTPALENSYHILKWEEIERQRTPIINLISPHLPNDIAKALSKITKIEDEEERIELLCSLASYIPTRIFHVVLAKVSIIRDEYQRSKWLISLATNTPHNLVIHIQPLVMTIGRADIRAKTLSGIIDSLPPEYRDEAIKSLFDAVLEVSDLIHLWDCAQIKDIVSWSQQLLSEQRLKIFALVLQNVTKIKDVDIAFATLIYLIPFLLPFQQTDAVSISLSVAARFKSPWKLAIALTSLAPYMPSDHEFWSDYVLPLLPTNKLGMSRVFALTGILEYVPPSLLSTVVDIASGLKSTTASNFFLFALTSMSSINERKSYVDHIVSSWSRKEISRKNLFMIVSLINHIPMDERANYIRLLMNESRSLNCPKRRFEVQMQLASISPQSKRNDILDIAFSTATQIGPPYSRSKALIRLAEFLPMTQQPLIISEALKSTKKTTPLLRMRLLAELMPHLQGADQNRLLREVLESILEVENIHQIKDELKTITQTLPVSLLPNALEVVSKISDTQDQVTILNILSPRLAEVQYDVFKVLPLRAMAKQGRSNLLRALTALLPCIVALNEEADNTDVLVDIYLSIIEIAQCWS